MANKKEKKEERHIVLTRLFNKKISSVSQAVNAQKAAFIRAENEVAKEFKNLKTLFLAIKEGIENKFHASVSLRFNDDFDRVSLHDGFFLHLNGEIFDNASDLKSLSYHKSTKFGFSIDNKWSDDEDPLNNYRMKALGNDLLSTVKLKSFGTKSGLGEYCNTQIDINFVYERLEEFITTAFDKEDFKNAVQGPPPPRFV